jgi:hypothetical protein
LLLVAVLQLLAAWLLNTTACLMLLATAACSCCFCFTTEPLYNML